MGQALSRGTRFLPVALALGRSSSCVVLETQAKDVFQRQMRSLNDRAWWVDFLWAGLCLVGAVYFMFRGQRVG
ncbi:MAG TPA: hypothetical protein VFT29_17600 [Gemmatimonadaceae bacterium]|nr:hypothetical protein [Gemmatimonadaceae bacterium]